MREMVGGCCVCSDESGWPDNPLVYCDGNGCTVAVHQACYGIQAVPTGPWFCRKCESQEKSIRVKCELCPQKDGALKKTDTQGWCHVLCGLYIPEAWFGNVQTMEPIVLKDVPADRFNKPCYVCIERGRPSKSETGACMQCNRTGCDKHFHVTCAQSAGLLCEESSVYVDNVKYCGYCKSHLANRNHDQLPEKQDVHLKPIPAFRCQLPISPLTLSNDSLPDPNKKPKFANSTFHSLLTKDSKDVVDESDSSDDSSLSGSSSCDSDSDTPSNSNVPPAASSSTTTSHAHNNASSSTAVPNSAPGGASYRSNTDKHSNAGVKKSATASAEIGLGGGATSSSCSSAVAVSTGLISIAATTNTTASAAIGKHKSSTLNNDKSDDEKTPTDEKKDGEPVVVPTEKYSYCFENFMKRAPSIPSPASSQTSVPGITPTTTPLATPLLSTPLSTAPALSTSSSSTATTSTAPPAPLLLTKSSTLTANAAIKMSSISDKPTTVASKPAAEKKSATAKLAHQPSIESVTSKISSRGKTKGREVKTSPNKTSAKPTTAASSSSTARGSTRPLSTRISPTKPTALKTDGSPSKRRGKPANSTRSTRENPTRSSNRSSATTTTTTRSGRPSRSVAQSSASRSGDLRSSTRINADTHTTTSSPTLLTNSSSVTTRAGVGALASVAAGSLASSNDVESKPASSATSLKPTSSNSSRRKRNHSPINDVNTVCLNKTARTTANRNATSVKNGIKADKKYTPQKDCKPSSVAPFVPSRRANVPSFQSMFREHKQQKVKDKDDAENKYKLPDDEPQPSSILELLECQLIQGKHFLLEQGSYYDFASLMDTLDKIHNENIVMEKTLHLLNKRREHLLNVNYRLAHPAHPAQSPMATDNAAAIAAAAILDSQVYAKLNAAAAMESLIKSNQLAEIKDISMTSSVMQNHLSQNTPLINHSQSKMTNGIDSAATNTTTTPTTTSAGSISSTSASSSSAAPSTSSSADSAASSAATAACSTASGVPGKPSSLHGLSSNSNEAINTSELAEQFWMLQNQAGVISQQLSTEQRAAYRLIQQQMMSQQLCTPIPASSCSKTPNRPHSRSSSGTPQSLLHTPPIPTMKIEDTDTKQEPVASEDK